MASVPVVSYLSPEEQASRLLEFVHEQGGAIAPSDALAICKSLQLRIPTHSNVASRRIQEDLAARGICVSRPLACEALARLCGGQNWMRVRQQMMALASQAAQAQSVLCFCVHFQREDGVSSSPVVKLAFSELADVILERVRDTWPTDVSPALCTVAVGKQGLTIELEHSAAPWLSVRVWSFRSSPEHSEANLPPLQDLPEAEVRAMVEKLERALEYTHPGTLVIGATRSEHLSPHFLFAPEITMRETGFRRVCDSALDTYLWLGSCDNEFSELQDGTYSVKTSEGQMLLEAKWRSEESGMAQSAPLGAKQLQAILNRTSRLKRLTGMKMTEFLGAHAGGKRAGDAVAQQLDIEPVVKGMETKGWSARDLAREAGLPLNTVLRVIRYGYAQVDVVPKLATALGISDSNKLLANEEGGQLGLRIDDAESFLRMLRNTHLWRMVLGEGLQGEEEEEVSAIADSLKEYVEVLQFEASIFKGEVQTNDPRILEPVVEGRITSYVQEHLDELAARGICVLVACNVRFMRSSGEFAHMNNMPLNQSTVFFEKASLLKKPATLS